MHLWNSITNLARTQNDELLNPANKPSFDAIVAMTLANGWKAEFIHVAVAPKASDETADRNHTSRLSSVRMKTKRGIEPRI